MLASSIPDKGYSRNTLCVYTVNARSVNVERTGHFTSTSQSIQVIYFNEKMLISNLVHIAIKSSVGHLGKWTQHPHENCVHINLYYMVNYLYVFAVAFSIES
jgi:hypothetical protein